MSKDIAQVLRAAAEYMSEHGKCEGAYEDDDGAVCAFGAVAAVQDLMITRTSVEGTTYKTPIQTRAADALEKWLSTQPGNNIDSVIVWSDRNDAETVILGIKRAAEWAESQS